MLCDAVSLCYRRALLMIFLPLNCYNVRYGRPRPLIVVGGEKVFRK